MSKIEYEAQLAEALAGVSPRAVMVCQAWHDHFGQPGWGSVDFVRGELGKATAALKALGEDVSFTARAPTPITSPALPPSVPEESETVKEKEKLIKELQSKMRAFVGTKIEPINLTKMKKVLQEELGRWVSEMPDPIETRVTDEGDGKISVALYDRLGRMLGFDWETNTLVAFDKDGNVLKHKKEPMTEELKDNPIDCHDQADAEAKALIAASPKLKCLMWDDGEELPVEYLYMNAAGVLVVCKAFENKIAEWLKPLIKGAGRDWNLRPEEIIEEGNGARGLLKHLFPGCEFEE